MAQVKVYAVGIGQFKGPFAFGRQRKVERQAIEIIKKQQGMIGIHPVPGKGTLLLFRTENDAKIGMNRMEADGLVTGGRISECWVDDKYMLEE